jgi:hypothetical protein
LIRRAGELILSLAFFILVQGLTTARAEVFTTLSFSADMIVRESGYLLVREKIAVNFTTPQHGLLRELSTLYPDFQGVVVARRPEVFSVSDGEDKPRTFKLSEQDGILSIQIGDADKLLAGPQVYLITYGIEDLVLSLEGQGTLHRNVIGYWPGAIDTVSAKVTVEQALEESRMEAACTAGGEGAADKTCTASIKGRVAEYLVTRPLAPGERFIISLNWQKEE